jgi:hypothetical protein
MPQQYAKGQVLNRVFDPADNTIRTKTVPGSYTEIVERQSSLVTLIGLAAPGSLTSAAVWQIRRVLTQGVTVTTEYAGTGAFDQIWDDRDTLFGTPAFTNLQSIQFDGVNDRLSAPHSTDLNFERTDAFSLSFWVRLDNVAAAHFILSKRENAGNVRGWQSFYAISGTPGISLILSSTNVGNRLSVTGPTLTANTWYHILWTYNGNSLASGIKLYVNGVSSAMTTIESTLTTTIQTAVTTQIGSRDSATGSFMAGYCDEVAIYNIELNSLQAAEVYNAGAVVDLLTLTTAGDLVSWWRMGDGSTYPTIDDEAGTNPMTMLSMTNGSIVTVVP